MKLELENLKLEDGEITATLKFLADFKGLFEGRYGVDGIKSQIIEKVSYQVSQEILKKRSGEILEKIDIEEIIKRVQLQTIDSVLGRDNRRY